MKNDTPENKRYVSLEDILYDNRPTKNIRDIMEEYLLYGYGDPKRLAAIIFKNSIKERK